ncbi:MAG: Mu transposase domain-containing protein, partial [Microvirga sp.]
LRGSVDFDTLAAYRAFVAGVIADHNRRHGDAIEIERTHLKALPPAPPVTWDEASVRVTSSSGFSFRHAFYTVPSRLIGHRLHLRVHDDRIEAFLGGMPVLTLPRGRAPAKTAKRTTTHIVDYRHVIGSLCAKPGALAGLTYRDALWPRPAYRRAWEALLAVQPVRDASRTMVDLLALAHDRGIEADIAAALDAILDEGGLPVFAEIQARFIPKAASAPTVWIEMPSASAYDPLLSDRRWEMTP